MSPGESATRQSHSWSPSPEDGLTGDQYLTEEIAQHVDDLSDAHEPAVYVLELSTPDTSSYEAHARLWLQEHGAVPDYLESIAATERLLYVGAAKNVYDRLQEHLNHPNRSSDVAEVFPIHSVVDVQRFDTPTEAFDAEHGIAMDLANEEPDAHVHSR
jgi:predicted GIY-YIG superfamily endonuclease